MNETMIYGSGPYSDQPVSNSRILSLTEEAHVMVSGLEQILGPVLIRSDEKLVQSKEQNDSEAVSNLAGLCNRLTELKARIRL